MKNASRRRRHQGAAGLVVLAASVGMGAIAMTRAQSPAGATTTAAVFNGARAFEDLEQMVALGPRPAGSPALRETRAYITHQLASAGLTVEEQPFTATTPIGPTAMVNLVVTLPGRRTGRILLTGHYDTKRSLDFPFVGASDAASSAAILIELARALKGRPHEFTYEFVWFDGEEATCWNWDQCSTPGAPDNLYGSRHYVEAARAADALTSIKAMILFDMIGAKDLKLRRENEFSAAWLNTIVWRDARRLGHADTFLDSDLPVDDDHLPFSQAGVATIDLIDIQDYPEWHTAQDDLAHVEARSLQVVGDVMLAALPDIEQHLLH